mmetsp:Transcript_1502/g.2373  ORF Transcript_1502/g.2373 Transcript_1502/m.2373 type:complete len:99 (+) Transcript_1502:415-711(+)
MGFLLTVTKNRTGESGAKKQSAVPVQSKSHQKVNSMLGRCHWAPSVPTNARVRHTRALKPCTNMLTLGAFHSALDVARFHAVRLQGAVAPPTRGLEWK